MAPAIYLPLHQRSGAVVPAKITKSVGKKSLQTVAFAEKGSWGGKGHQNRGDNIETTTTTTSCWHCLLGDFVFFFWGEIVVGMCVLVHLQKCLLID